MGGSSRAEAWAEAGKRLRLVVGSMTSLMWRRAPLAPLGSKSLAQLKCVSARCVSFLFLYTWKSQRAVSAVLF